MKRNFRIFGILVSCFVLCGMFTSCDAILNIMLYSAPDQLVIRDNTNSLRDTDFTVNIYKTDRNGNRLSKVLYQDITISSSTRETVYFGGKIIEDYFYEIELINNSNSKKIEYSTAMPNLSKTSNYCFIQPKSDYSYRLSLEEIRATTYKFRLEEILNY